MQNKQNRLCSKRVRSILKSGLIFFTGAANTTFLTKCNFFENSLFNKISNLLAFLFKKRNQVTEYVTLELSNLFIPLTCQSLSAMFCVYSHHDIWKGHKEKQLYNCFQEPRSKDKGFRNKREVLTITAPEVKMQNSVLIIGDD